MRWKKSLLTAALSGAVLLGGVTLMSTTAKADSCRDIGKEERELDRNIRRYGYYSSQANRDRWELRRMRESCRGNNRGFWGGNGGFWRGDGDNDRDDRRGRGWRGRDWDHDRDDHRWRGRDHDRDHDRNAWRRGRDHDRDHDHDRH